MRDISNNRSEFIGNIIDTFEDFLEEKEVVLNNPEISEAVQQGEDPDALALIYGSDYDILKGRLDEMLQAWEANS